MIQHYTRADAIEEPRLFETMHRDRKRVFVDALKWDIAHDGIREADQYDTHAADYLILRDPKSGEHLGSVRLLPTTGPHMLGDVFRHLCEGGVPHGPRIREITRFVVSPDLAPRDRVSARNMLGRAMIEFGLMVGVSTYTAVCDFGFLNQLLASGWHIRPLGLPQYADETLLCAIQIRLDRHSLGRTNITWRTEGPALRIAQPANTLVA